MSVIRVDDNRVINESDVSSSELKHLREIENFSTYLMPNGETAEEYFKHIIIDISEEEEIEEETSEEFDIYKNIPLLIKSISDQILSTHGENLTKHLIPIIESIVNDAVEKIPLPMDGKDGEDINKEEVFRFIENKIEIEIEKLPKPKDGKSVTVEDISPIIEDLVSRYISNIPKPRDGRDGRDGNSVEPAYVNAVIKEIVDKFPKPKDGERGKDGRDGVDGKDGNSVDIEETDQEIIFKVENTEKEAKLSKPEKPKQIEFTISGNRVGLRYEGDDEYEWTDNLKGNAGLGVPGDRGKSAYEIWRKNGHIGTEEDFLNWLRNNPQQFEIFSDVNGRFIVDYSFLNLSAPPAFITITPWLSDSSTVLAERVVTFSVEDINNNGIVGYVYRKIFRNHFPGAKNLDFIPAKNNKITVTIGV